MSDAPKVGTDGLDIGEYCREVEAHLTRVNEGHLIRLVGPGFEMVRRWALDGIPLSIVRQGVDMKSERHKAGRSTRPLRLEFCESDVLAVYADWKRAVGLMVGATPVDDTGHTEIEDRRRPSLAKHLDRVIERLVRVAGRLEWPDVFRDQVNAVIDEFVAMRDAAKSVRGAAREEFIHRLPAIDARVMEAARGAAPRDVVDRLSGLAADELAAFSGRMTTGAWQRSVELGTDRLLREHFGLPVIELS